jgi:hypothetical protein
MDADLERTRAMFANMVSDGLDVSLPLRWGYFFFHEAPEPLGELAEEMQQFGYAGESLHEADDGQWVLQLCKTEVHTPESLHRRNEKLNELAASRAIDLYDGWDVSVPGAVIDSPTDA